MKLRIVERNHHYFLERFYESSSLWSEVSHDYRLWVLVKQANDLLNPPTPRVVWEGGS